MRKLTITRRKSFVGCIGKDRVYVRDEQTKELTIDGVPCRKIGELKNGEIKTFEIGEGEQQIFLISDKISKDYCNATVTVPEGQEDVALSGVHKFVLGSNPFRFDNVPESGEQLAKYKKNNRKGTVILIASVIFGLAVGSLLPKVSFSAQKASPKTFTKEEFQITLTDAFESTEEEGFFAFYTSKAAVVFIVREDKAFFGDITVEEYGDLVLEANGRTDIQANQEDDFIWFEYTDTPDGQETYYLAVCCRSEDAFWIINFATPASNRKQYKNEFLSWAKSIKID